MTEYYEYSKVILNNKTCNIPLFYYCSVNNEIIILTNYLFCMV